MTTNYTPSYFISYINQGGDPDEDNDCQNFVSQAIWYEMGGRSSANKDLPMYTDWWANLTGETNKWHWTGSTYFEGEITDHYYNNDYGLQGYSVSTSNLVEEVIIFINQGM